MTMTVPPSDDVIRDVNVERLIADHANPKYQHLTKEIDSLLKLLAEKIFERARIEVHLKLNELMK